MVDKAKFLSSNGQKLTKALFIEYAYVYPDRLVTPPYTLAREDKTVDGVVYPSLYRLYMELGDITEGFFVEKYMYNLAQWEMLCATGIFKDEINEWRKELRHKLFAKAVNILENDAQDPDSKSSTASAKFLIERVYGKRSNPGRPSPKGERGPGSGQDREDNVVLQDFTRLFEKS